MRKELLKLAIPNIAANLSIPLLSIINVAVLAHLESTTYLASVSLATVIFNFILWSFGFLRMSTTGITAQNFGAKNDMETMNSLLRSVIIATTIGIIIIFSKNYILYFGIKFLQPNESIKGFVGEYYNIRIWVIPASLVNLAIVGWLLGIQDSAGAMLIIIFENLVNIVLNIFFVVNLDMNIEGVALGILIAGWIALFFGIVIIFTRHKNKFITPFTNSIFATKKLLRVLTINANIFIRSFGLMFVFSYFTYASSRFGNDILALNTLLLQFFMFFSFFIDGLSYAGESLSGKYLGAGKIKMLHLVTQTIFKWAFGSAIAFSFLYFVGGQWMFSILTDNEKLISLAYQNRIWVILIPIVSFAAFVWDGIFAGTTQTAKMRNVMIVAVLVVFFPVFFILKNIAPETNLWIAFISFFIARSVGMTLIRPRFLKLKSKKNT